MKMAWPDAPKSDSMVTHISDNFSEITVLSGEVIKFSNLQKLLLNNNRLQQISADIWSLKELEALIEELDLQANQLSVLPNIFDQLLNLKKLDLGFNRLPDDEVKSIQYQVDCDFLNIAGQGTSSASNS